MSFEQASWPHEFTEAQVTEWKKVYGSIWTVKVGGKEYVYRGLTNTEFEKLRDEERKFISDLEQKGLTQEAISQATITNSMRAVVLTTLLYPGDYGEKLSTDLAGVLEVLQPAILEASGFPTEPPVPQEL